MTEPKLQTRLSVLTGTTAEPRMVFVWGQEVSPISVGASGEWTIGGDDVRDLHLFVSFDGRQVHVAAASPDAHVTVRGQPVGAEWHPVPVPSEVVFGSARIAVSCEERGSSAAGFGSTWQVEQEIPQPNLNAVAHERSEFPVRPRSGTARLGSIEDIERLKAMKPAAPQREPQPAAPRPPVAPVPTAPVQQIAISPAPPVAQRPAMSTVDPPETTLAAVTPPAGAAPPPPIVPLVSVPVAPAEPAPLAAPPQAALPMVAQPPIGPTEEMAPVESNPISTLHDGGKLREQAKQGQPPVAGAAPGGHPPAAPVHGAPPQGAAAGLPWAPPQPAAQWPADNAPIPETPEKAPNAFVQSWRETSLVKKLILALLPFAAVVGLFPELLESAPEPRARAVTPKPAASAEASPSAAASPSASVAAALASAPALVSAAPEAPDPVDAKSRKRNTASELSTQEVNDSSMLTKTAIDAAFAGHHSEAAELYERLAKERSNDPVYQTAARLAREGAVRKP